MAEHHLGPDGKNPDPYKSEGERQIARFLHRLGIAYRYEYPLAVVDRGKTRLWYADFLLPEYGIILEYAGMEDSASYENALEHKKAVYADLGLSVIYVEPETFRGFWPRRLAEGIEAVLTERLATFRGKMGDSADRQEAAKPCTHQGPCLAIVMLEDGQ